MRPLLLLATSLSLYAQVCDPPKLTGPYAFQLSGTTTISGDEKPVTSLGRLVFDGHGNTSGSSSTMFAGYLQGNPITGTYELRTDCTLTWKLQDDSGAFQLFTGTMSPDLARAQIRQTVAGAIRGLLEKSAESCTDQDLQKKYSYTVTGSTTPMLEGQTARTISASGTLDVARTGTFHVDSDCTVQFDLILHGADERLVSLHMRGMLVNGGREILAIETDPGAMVSARLRAAP